MTTKIIFMQCLVQGCFLLIIIITDIHLILLQIGKCLTWLYIKLPYVYILLGVLMAKFKTILTEVYYIL